MVQAVPPHDTKAEAAVLAGVLIRPASLATVADRLQPRDFYDTRHQRIYDAMLAIWSEGRAPDPHTLRDTLCLEGDLERVGDEFLASLAYATGTARNVEAHADIVATRAVERRLIAACVETQTACYAHDPRALSLAQSAIVHATGNQIATVRAARDIHAEIVPDLDRPDHTPRLRYNLPDLERHMVLSPGWLIYVAGRTNHGKSALASKVAWEVSRFGKRVLYVTMEMTERELLQRQLSAASGVPYTMIATGRCSADEVAAVQSVDTPDGLHLVMRSDVDAVRVRAMAHSMRARHGLDLLVVDYLQQMRHPEAERRDLAVGQTSRALKLMALDFEIPVMVCAQLNRQSEGRQDGRPAVSDLRESGSIEQDADCVALVWRPWVQSRDSKESELKVIVGKNRHDPPGDVVLDFDAETMSISCSYGREFDDQRNAYAL